MQTCLRENKYCNNDLTTLNIFTFTLFRMSQSHCSGPHTLFSCIHDLAMETESSWNVMAHRDAGEGKWKGNWRMERVASTLHTTSEHSVSSITTADTHTSAVSSRLNWCPRQFKWTRPYRTKDEIWFLRICHHISNAVYRTAEYSVMRFGIEKSCSFTPTLLRSNLPPSSWLK